jgi:hypothetical protein
MAIQMVMGYCNRCGKPVGQCSWDSADWVFHKACAKAREVYTPPGPMTAIFQRINRENPGEDTRARDSALAAADHAEAEPPGAG